MDLSSSPRRRVVVMWLSGLAGLVIGAFGGWWLGVFWADATPPDPSEPFAGMGTVFGSALLGVILVPLLAVFSALRVMNVGRPLSSGFVFLISSAIAMGILVRIGTLLLPVNIGIQPGAIVVAILGTLGGAIATDRLVR